MKTFTPLKRVFLSLLLLLCFVLAFPGAGSAIPVQASQKKSAPKKLYTSGNWKLIENSRMIYCYVNGKKVEKAWRSFDSPVHLWSGVWLSGGKMSGITPLHFRVNSLIHSFPGTWSVYVKNLKTGESFCLNNRPMCAASVIKLFAMGAAYQRVADGKLSLESVSGLISTMIADSNNSAFNSIVRKIGRTYVNTWCRTQGYTQTSQVHGLSPADNNSGIRIASGNNVTTVSDCGHFLESVYNGTCVNSTYSEQMVDNLKKITRDKSLYYRSKLPSGIPSSAVCANKTGDLNDYAHDCAIVYGEKTDYIICVMAHVPGRGYSCSSYYRKLSSMVYDFFN